MYDLNNERSEDFDRTRLRCNVTVAGLGKSYGLSIDEAECVTKWIDDWYDDPEYYFNFFNMPDKNGETGFNKWLDEFRARYDLKACLIDALGLDWSDNGNLSADALRDRCIEALARNTGKTFGQIREMVEANEVAA